MEIVFTLPELAEAAAFFLRSTGDHRVIALQGVMGAGKTTFINAYCQAAGVTANISSPTFALVHEYPTQNGEVIFHMDWYRLANEAGVVQAGLEEPLYSGMTCLVEWPDRALSLFPVNTVYAHLEVLDPLTRRLRYE